MNNPNPSIGSARALPLIPPTLTYSKTRTTALSVAFAALVWLVALASAPTPASAQAVNFDSVNVCPAGKSTPTPCSATKTVTFNIPAGTTISSIPILTTGQPNLDFKAKADDPSTTLCAAKTYSSPTTCTVDVTFAPLAPGGRKGAVELLDGATVVALTYVYGTGVSPEIAFSPSVKKTLAALPLGPGFDYLRPMAVDASGNVFIADNGNDAIKEFVAATGTVKTLLSDPSQGLPTAVAVDGAGNVFFLASNDYTGDPPGGVYELLAAGGYATLKTINTSFTPDYGLAIDGSGNLFVDDFASSEIKEILAAGGYTTVKVLGSGFEDPESLALDAEGNVYVGNNYPTNVEKILAAGGYTTVQILAEGSGFAEARGLAVDAAENVYFAGLFDNDLNSVYEILAAGGYATVNNVGTNFNQIHNVAIDAAGNLYVTDRDPELRELLRPQPTAFDFGSVTVDTISSLLSTTVQNIGNATLNFYGDEFTGSGEYRIAAGSGTPPDCDDSLTLASSAECNVSVEFIPESAGTKTGSLILQNDSGNATDAMPAIALTGRGVAAAVAQVSPTILQFGSIAYPGSATQPLTITNTGTGTLTIDPSSNGRGAIITGNACGSGVAAGKSCTLQVEFDPVQLGLNTNTLTIQTNGATNPAVPVRGTATGVGSVSTVLDFGTIIGRGLTKTLPLTITNFGVPGTVTIATSTGATTFHVTSNGCTSGITAGNSCTIEVEYAPVQTGSQTAYLKLTPSTGLEQVIVMEGAQKPY